MTRLRGLLFILGIMVMSGCTTGFDPNKVVKPKPIDTGFVDLSGAFPEQLKHIESRNKVPRFNDWHSQYGHVLQWRQDSALTSELVLVVAHNDRNKAEFIRELMQRQWLTQSRYSDLAASFQVSANSEALILQLESLSTDTKSVWLSLNSFLNDFKIEPAQLEQVALATAVKNLVSKQIATSEVDQLLMKQLYPESHPYHHGLVSTGTAKEISHVELTDFFASSFDISKRVWVIKSSSEVMQSLKLEPVEFLVAKPAEKATTKKVSSSASTPRIYLKHKDNAKQTSIATGVVTFDQNDPRLPISQFIAKVLSDRLFNDLREKQGLTYSAYAVQYQKPMFGPFVVKIACENYKTAACLSGVLSHVQAMQERELDTKELSYYKDSMLNSGYRDFLSSSALALNILKYKGLQSYLVARQQGQQVLGQLNADKVRTMAKAIFADKLDVVLVGDEDIILPQLKTYFPDVDITRL